MTRGLVIGKFYPPHLGHKYLIDTARAGVDQLTIIVCGKTTQTISPELRAAWLAQIHPDATIKVIYSNDTDLPEDDSEAWAKATKKWLGYTPDVVYTSENYGHAYTKYLGCRHVSVDEQRLKYPVSGTKVRAHPLENTRFLHPVVRAHFIKRVCVVGAESSGTTTLTKALAKHYGAPLVPEYGRVFTEKQISKYGNDYEWKSTDFEHIARKQNEIEDALALEAEKLLICDTNSWLTSVFHRSFMGKRSRKVDEIAANRHYDLYLLTDIDFPFEQDGFRKDEKIRQQTHRQFVRLLGQGNTPYAVVSGPPEERFQAAAELIDKILG